jgi:hypothetical protein
MRGLTTRCPQLVEGGIPKEPKNHDIERCVICDIFDISDLLYIELFSA